MLFAGEKSYDLFLFKMFWFHKLYRAPSRSGTVILGRTLPSLLDEGCDRTLNTRALNHWHQKGWKSLSNHAFRTAAEELALGLLTLDDVGRGDRIGLFMDSDINFCLADMGGLLAGLVTVPIEVSQANANIVFMLQKTEAKTLIVSTVKRLRQIAPCLMDLTHLKQIVVADVSRSWRKKVPDVPVNIQIVSLDELRATGKCQISDSQTRRLRATIAPTDLATIIYTDGPTGIPRGVMLTHENISADILAAFTSIPSLRWGKREVALSFLPLTHVFARAFIYGHFAYGHSIYFTTPTRVAKHLKDVRPTVFITVPRLLEKVHRKILDRGGQLKGVSNHIFNWALGLAQRYELGRRPKGFYALQLFLANQLVFARWRAAIGGRLKYLISGGAALKAEINNLFVAAGIPVMQGYGLTETSSVMCYNRRHFNRAGTVGHPIAGVKIAIADDNEILVKSPYVMQGYYNDLEATRAAIDEAGWFHTGDLGRFTAEGVLKLTGCKKDLFKLSTGKYVTPLPLEQKVQQSLLVARAIAVGAHQKFCTLLIVPDLQHLEHQAKQMGLDLPGESLLDCPSILELYQTIANDANHQLPRWSTVKRFCLIDATFAVENGLLRPDLTLNRPQIERHFATEIDAMYQEETIPKNETRTQKKDPSDNWLPVAVGSQLMTTEG